MHIVTANRPLFLSSTSGHCATLLPGIPTPIHESLYEQAIDKGCQAAEEAPGAPAAPPAELSLRERVKSVVQSMLDDDNSDPDDYRTDGTPKRAAVQRLLGSSTYVDANMVFDVYAEIVTAREKEAAGE